VLEAAPPQSAHSQGQSQAARPAPVVPSQSQSA
jgi:hypothetical protein